jgi:S1-C subfamily serine protease
VEPGSPAEQAGIRGGQLDVVLYGQALLLGGDIITHLNDKPVDTPERLTGAMRSLHVGDTLRVTLFRRDQTQEVTLILPERPLLPQDVLVQRSVAPLGGPRAVGRPGYRL